METIVYKFCRVCNQDKLCSEFREKRRVCKKCIYKENQIKYKDVIKQYYVENQEKIIQRSIEYHKKKMELQGRKNQVVRELSMLINKLKSVMKLLIKRFLYFNIYFFNIYYNII
jgi:hypothetical protein